MDVDSIYRSITEQVRFTRGEFHLIEPRPENARDTASEIPPDRILIQFIENVDKSWPYDFDPTPRVLGQLIELLRGCRFATMTFNINHFIIYADKRKARGLGAFDTPEQIVRFITSETLKPTESGRPPIVVDPACGAGYFLLEAIDISARMFPDYPIRNLVEDHIAGMDIDPVAVSLSERNIRWHLARNHKIDPDEISLNRSLFCVDALSEFSNLPIEQGSADCVIGNPPYQFFSGKGSPVAALRNDGNYEGAHNLKSELDVLKQRFPESSVGCIDRYKWFIDRAIELVRDRGRIGFITPNTWLAYPRYRDIRMLLRKNGNMLSITDLGSFAFKRAHVPASIFVWGKTPERSIREFPYLKITQTQWRSVVDGKINIPNLLQGAPGSIISDSCEIIPAHAISAVTQEPHRVRLSDIAVLREGSHKIHSVKHDTPREINGTADFPVLIDKAMSLFRSPDIGYIEPPENLIKSDEHSGQRFLIRKTGDRLIAAPVPTDNFALAHQNVYVGKVKNNGIPFFALLGILSSDLLTGIYREGPGGQYRRPHAQLRIAFLNDLPVVIVPEEFRESNVINDADIAAFTEKFTKGNLDEIDPVPQTYPSDIESRMVSARLIALHHAAIESLTRKLLHEKNDKIRIILNRMVDNLYDIRR